MPDELAPRARVGCEGRVGYPCPSVPCDELAWLRLRTAGFPQGRLAQRASAEGWTACRGPLGARTVAAQRVDGIHGDQFQYRGVARRYDRPQGATMKYWSGSSVEVHLEVESRSPRPRPDCFWFGVDLLRFELVAGVLPGTKVEKQARQTDSRTINAPENRDAFMWFNDLGTEDEDVYGLVPFDPTWLQSSVLRMAEKPYFVGCLPVVASGPGEEVAGEPCYNSPRRAGYFAPGELVKFVVPSPGSERSGTTVLTFAFASDLFFFTNDLGRVLDRSGKELWARHTSGSFPLMWYNLGFEAVFVYRAWAIDHRGLKCNLWPFAVRAGLSARSLVPGRELPAELLSSTIPVLANESAPMHYATEVKNRFGGYVYEKPLVRGEYPADPEEPLSCVLGASSRVTRLELEIGAWPRLFVLEAGPARLIVPELTDPGRSDAIPEDTPILAVKVGDNRLGRLEALPDPAWRAHPFLLLPLPRGTALAFAKETLAFFRDPRPHQSVKGTPVGGWEDFVRVDLETDAGGVIPCVLKFFLEQGERCYPYPKPVPVRDPLSTVPPELDMRIAYGGNEYKYENRMAMRCTCWARVGDELAEFAYAPDLGQFNSASFLSIHGEERGSDGRTSYVNKVTGARYGAPAPPTDRDCVTEESVAQVWLRFAVDFTPLAPLFLAFEALSGESWTSGMKLTDTERVIAGVGIAISVVAESGMLRRTREQGVVDKFIDRRFPGGAVTPEMMNDFLEGASTLEQKHIAVIEKVARVMQKSKGPGNRLSQIREALTDAEMKLYREAASRIMQVTLARRTVDSVLGSLSKREQALVEQFRREQRVTASMRGDALRMRHVSIEGEGVLVEMGDKYETAKVLARQGHLVISPARTQGEEVARQLYREVLQAEIDAGRGAAKDVLVQSADQLTAIEVLKPKMTGAWATRGPGDLGVKLRSPQSLHIVVEIPVLEGSQRVSLNEILDWMRKALDTETRRGGTPLIRSLGVLHDGKLSLLPGLDALDETLACVVFQRAAPLVGHAPLIARELGRIAGEDEEEGGGERK